MPDWISPELCTLVDQAPEGDQWFHEIKYDGYRFVAVKTGPKVRLFTRNRKDWSDRFPAVVAAVSALAPRQLILDGEIVVLNDSGISDFQALQNLLQMQANRRIYYFLFDLLYQDGVNLTQVPLVERKSLLSTLLAGQPEKSPLRFSPHVRGSGSSVYAKACRTGLEGIIAKKADSRYESRRSRSWLKVKCLKGQEFVIGGFTDPSGVRTGFGALLLGYYVGDALHYCGKVGTGFNDQTLRTMAKQLNKIKQNRSPFINPPTGSEARGVHWVAPRLVAQVSYSNITSDGNLRHPAFEGLRMDKKASQVKREISQKPPGKGKTSTGRTGQSLRPASGRARVAKQDEIETAGVRLTHPEKVLFPDVDITKRELADYYDKAADLMVPHLQGRPLMFVRCPQGAAKPCFYQKHPTHDTIPPTLQGVRIREKTKTETYLIANDLSGIVTLVQFSALEIHTWGCKARDLEHPDRLIFDLDPGPGVKWNAVRDAALLVRDNLQRLGLTSFVKTSGGKGLHVIAPIRPQGAWGEIKALAQSFTNAIVESAPQQFVGKMTKSIRGGKIFIDYLRNGRGSTCVAAYSTRARPGAPLSMPIAWKDLNKVADPQEFTIKSAVESLKRHRKAWEGFFTMRQSIPARFLRAVRT